MRVCECVQIRGATGAQIQTPISHWSGHTGSLDETGRRGRQYYMYYTHTKMHRVRIIVYNIYRLHKRPNNAHRGLTYLYNMCSVGFKRFRWVVPSPVAVHKHTHTQKCSRLYRWYTPNG